MSWSSSRTVDSYIVFLINCFLYVLYFFGDIFLVEDVLIEEGANVEEPAVTMNLRDVCSLALVERSGIFYGRLEYRRIWGNDCNGVKIVVVWGGGCEKENFDEVGGGGCEKENFDGVGGGGSNGGTIEVVRGGGIEVVGGGGSERIKFRRVGGGDVVSLDNFGVRRLTLIVEIVFELGEESLVLLSYSNSIG